MMGSWSDLKYQAEWDLKSNKKVVGDYLGIVPIRALLLLLLWDNDFVHCKDLSIVLL